jgi:hypothetical protein
VSCLFHQFVGIPPPVGGPPRFPLGRLPNPLISGVVAIPGMRDGALHGSSGVNAGVTVVGEGRKSRVEVDAGRAERSREGSGSSFCAASAATCSMLTSATDGK